MSAVKNGWLSNHYFLGDEITFESIGVKVRPQYRRHHYLDHCS